MNKERVKKIIEIWGIEGYCAALERKNAELTKELELKNIEIGYHIQEKELQAKKFEDKLFNIFAGLTMEEINKTLQICKEFDKDFDLSILHGKQRGGGNE